VSQGTQLAGTGFIFHGGDTFHFGKNTGDYIGGTWNWNPTSGGPSGTSTNPVYVGVDQTWYSGGAWARPIFTADNSPCNSGTTGTLPDGATCTGSTDSYGQPSYYVSGCPYQIGSNNQMFALGNQDYIELDNIEMTGICQSLPGISGGGTQGQNVYVLYNSLTGPAVFENLYIHGSSHLQYAGPLTSSPCNATNAVCENNAPFTGSGPSGGVGDTVVNNVVDFSDSDPGGSFLCIGGGFYNVAYNVFRYTTSCLPKIHLFHDNLYEYFFENGHSNLLESEDPAGTNAIYNNVFRHIENLLSSNGGVFLWLGPASGATDYVFNNVMYDVGDGEYLNVGGVALTTVAGNYVFFNNTWQTNHAQSILNCQNQTIGSTIEANNHYIDDHTPYVTCSALTKTTSLWQSNTSSGSAPTYSDANTSPRFDQYTSSETNGYSPVAPTNSTVGAGTNESTPYCGALTTAGLTAVATACQSTTTYACAYNSTSHTMSCPGQTAVARQSAWDVGAYQFSSSVTGQALQPPTNLLATVQ